MGKQLMKYNLLSAREKEIFRLVSQGKTSNQIAKDLGLSHHTINTHRKNIWRKLKIKNYHDLILKSQLIAPQ